MLEEFAAIEEEGAEPLLGDQENVLFPGAATRWPTATTAPGKATLMTDLGFPLGRGHEAQST